MNAHWKLPQGGSEGPEQVAVRARWGPEVWYLKCATVLSHHGTMSHFPYWKDWPGYDCRLGVSFKPVGEAEWSSSKSSKQETKAVSYILWRKIKSMNKEERMGTSAKHSSCMALKTLPRKADTGKTKFLTVEMTPGWLELPFRKSNYTSSQLKYFPFKFLIL